VSVGLIFDEVGYKANIQFILSIYFKILSNRNMVNHLKAFDGDGIESLMSIWI